MLRFKTSLLFLSTATWRLQERRKEMAKLVSKLGEEGKIAIRQAQLWCHPTGMRVKFLFKKQSAVCRM